MRIFLLLLLSLPLLAKAPLYGDIDQDGKIESMELRDYGSNDAGKFYQLIVKDDNGNVLWKAKENFDESNPYSFFEAHHGISMPQILVDIDKDGKLELLAPQPQSDVSPTYFKRLKWMGRAFSMMPPMALMMQNFDRFEWIETQDYQGSWVSSFVGVEGSLVKVNITQYRNEEVKMGVALLEFDSRGANVIRWIESLQNPDTSTQDSTNKTTSKELKLNLQLTVRYSPNAKSKLQKSHERIAASLILSQYDNEEMKIEGVATKEALFAVDEDVKIDTMDIQQGHRFEPDKNYKVNINLYTAREVFQDNLLDCRSRSGDIDFDLLAMQGGVIEYYCKLIGE